MKNGSNMGIALLILAAILSMTFFYSHKNQGISTDWWADDTNVYCRAINLPFWRTHHFKIESMHYVRLLNDEKDSAKDAPGIQMNEVIFKLSSQTRDRLPDLDNYIRDLDYFIQDIRGGNRDKTFHHRDEHFMRTAALMAASILTWISAFVVIARGGGRPAPRAPTEHPTE